MTGDASPFVCVLTPVYNGADFIEQCIESVLAQDLHELRIHHCQ